MTDVTLNPVSAQSLSAVSAALADGAPVAADVSAQAILGGENVSVGSAVPDLEAILAQMRLETNEARLNAARSRLASALSQLTNLSEEEKAKVEEMKKVGEELAAAKAVHDADKADFEAKAGTLDSKEAALDDAQKAFDKVRNDAGSSQEDINAAKNRLDSAKGDYDAAKREYDAALAKYEASDRVVNDRQSRFDALVKSLDIASLTALREALHLFASDLDHLHDEIEKEDKKHSLSTIRSVEDVISDALKRLDGKMVDEIEDRHLDHV